MIRGDTSMSPQRARGFLAESRFFYLANVPPDPKSPPPRGFIRVEQAKPIADVRGIDGFVYHYRGASSTTPRRIPVQLKNGVVASTPFNMTHCGLRVPIITISGDMSQFNMFERIRRLLDVHERYRYVYDERHILNIERNRPTAGELEVVELIERSRNAFEFKPLVPYQSVLA